MDQISAARYLIKIVEVIVINAIIQVVMVPQTLVELYQTIALKLGMQVKRIYLANGGEVDDIGLIRDDDILYASEGDDFKINSRTNKRSDWVTLNVGGRCFTTSKSTLIRKEPASMLARMFAEDQGEYLYTPSNMDSSGAYLIDRSFTYFEPILNYLRNGQLIYDSHLNPEGILEEARFYGIESIIPTLEQIIKSTSTPRDDLPLTRRDIINTLIRSPYTAELRFQGVNLAGADLSKLDLRYINFKYANMQGCRLVGSNLSWCCLERADLSHAVLDGAQLLGNFIYYRGSVMIYEYLNRCVNSIETLKI